MHFRPEGFFATPALWTSALILFASLAAAGSAQAVHPGPGTQPQACPTAPPNNSAAADFAQLARYRQADQALLANPSQPPRVVFLGDSILDRWGKNAGVWFSQAGWVNRGVGGQTTSQMLLRERSDVLDLHPRAVVLEGGANDMRLGFTPQEIRDNFATLGELAQAHHIRVFVATMTPVCDCVRKLTGLRTMPRIAELNSLLKALCNQHHWTLIDLNPVLADAQGLMRAKYTSDGVHPTSAGYALLAPVILHALKKYE
jgi:lysophospholipase L1-like esterase